MNPSLTALLTESEFIQFQRLLVQESGLFFEADRRDTLRTVVAGRMQEHHLSTAADYYAFLTSGAGGRPEMKSFIELLTIGETYFFRNFPQFHALDQKILVPLIRERFNGSRTLSLWSAGCSTGEEVYSIAISLLETLPSPETWKISLLATDINREALKKAQRGAYNFRSIHDVPAPWLQKYFSRADDKFILDEKVKRMVRFCYLNLVTEPFNQPGMQEVDILFCRNVTIYFPLEITKRIVDQFADCLQDGGHFFTGGAETLWQISDRFSPVEFSDTLIYRKIGTAAAEVGRPESPPEPAFPQVPSLPVVQAVAAATTPAETLVAYREGMEALRTQLYDQAMESFEKALAFDPSFFRASLGRAFVHANQGRYGEAVPILKRLLAADSLFSEAHYLLGIVSEKLGNPDAAIAAFQRVIYVDPTCAMAHVALGNLYRFQNRYTKAQREFENAVKAMAGRNENEEVLFSEQMTCGYLRTVCAKTLEQIHAAQTSSKG